MAARKDLGLLPVPTWLRYDENAPPRFSLSMKLFFGFASTFSALDDYTSRLTPFANHYRAPAVANLYYCQPLLSECLIRTLGAQR